MRRLLFALFNIFAIAYLRTFDKRLSLITIDHGDQTNLVSPESYCDSHKKNSMVVSKFESRVDVGWYNRTGQKEWLCLVIARETRFDIA